MTTVLDGVRAALPGGRVDFVKGCDVKGPLDEISKAAAAARAADAAIVVLGENEWQARDGERRTGTSGEGFDSATLELTGRQEELARAVLAANPRTVVVLINGRPLATRWIAANVPALLEAWIPGERGGQAIAEVLFGTVNPSGRLPVTVPRHAGQLPVHYDQPRSKDYWLKHGWGVRYVDLDPTPLFPFGHGLSYSRFEYSNLRLSAKEIGSAGDLEVRIDVKNTGPRPGVETVQLYLHDVISSVGTPMMQLRGVPQAGARAGRNRDGGLHAAARRPRAPRSAAAACGRARRVRGPRRRFVHRHPTDRPLHRPTGLNPWLAVGPMPIGGQATHPEPQRRGGSRSRST